MRKLALLLLLVCFVPMAFSQTGGVGGTIPFIYDLDVTFDASAMTALSSIDENDYNAGYVDIIGFVSAASLLANDSCSVAVSMGSWTLPAGYPASGPKQDVTSNSDLHLRLVGIDGSDDVDIYNSFDSFQELTSSAQKCLMAETAAGVASADWTADARIDLAWGVDVAGSYGVTVTWTVSQETP